MARMTSNGSIATRNGPRGIALWHHRGPRLSDVALCNALSQQIFTITGIKMVLNYGLNRVRFPNPVPVGSRLRMSSDLMELKETRVGAQVVCKQTFEVEGQSKPACVAETIVRVFF